MPTSLNCSKAMFKASLSLASTTKNQTCPGASVYTFSEGYAGALHVFDDVGNEIHIGSHEPSGTVFGGVFGDDHFES